MEINGFQFFPGALTQAAQAELVETVLMAARVAPFYRPKTPGGRSMSVEQTSLGRLGWVTDAAGYRYESTHPVTNRPWPDMPAAVAALWTRFSRQAVLADACLVNLYRPGARMGLHQDADEADFQFPVVSVSLGDTAAFRLGGHARGDPTRGLRLASGDICVLGGEARRWFHGVDRILAGSSQLVPGGGRINLTLRRAR